VNTGGTLLFSASDAINHSATVTMAAGSTISMGSLSNATQTMGALTLNSTGTSVIDFGSGNTNTLDFASLTNASALTTGVLNIYDYTGSDNLLFGTNPSLNSTELGDIVFYSGGAGSTEIGTAAEIAFSSSPFAGSTGIVPVPEPSTIFWPVCLLGFLGWGNRRRIQKFVGRLT